MPTYEYECLKCEARFERFQQMTDPPVRKCPVCGGKVKRLIGAGAGILFKGSGFYITDYRSKDYHSRAKADKEPAASGPRYPSGSASGGAGGSQEPKGAPGDAARGGGPTKDGASKEGATKEGPSKGGAPKAGAPGDRAHGETSTKKPGRVRGKERRK
jgi:putative FmdB family regulatory protein